MQKNEVFYGTLGTWKTCLVYFELKLNYKLICSQPYPIPNIHEEISKKEVELLVLPGVLENPNEPEWGGPYFPKTKPKTNWLRFISDFRNLNKQLKCNPYQICKTN